jgi:hypothetical protein
VLLAIDDFAFVMVGVVDMAELAAAHVAVAHREVGCPVEMNRSRTPAEDSLTSLLCGGMCRRRQKILGSFTWRLIKIPGQLCAHGIGHHGHVGVVLVIHAENDSLARLFELGDLRAGEGEMHELHR